MEPENSTSRSSCNVIDQFKRKALERCAKDVKKVAEIYQEWYGTVYGTEIPILGNKTPSYIIYVEAYKCGLKVLNILIRTNRNVFVLLPSIVININRIYW